MCGIIGYIGNKEAAPLMLDGLKRLEYRGYDSAGVAVMQDHNVKVVRCEGKLYRLEEKLKDSGLSGSLGLGHTRWATHGRPSENNAHPHTYNGVVVVHNGIIENYLQLKQELQAAGNEFSSETDTEIVSHLVARELETAEDFLSAVLVAVRQLKGSFALGIMWEKAPDQLIAVRMESPLILGLGEGENFLASDIPAILRHTRQVVYLDDGEVAHLTRHKATVYDLAGQARKKIPRKVAWTLSMAEKEGYKHFMQKEIFEQPRALTDTIRGYCRVAEGKVELADAHLSTKTIRGLKKIIMLACGTSWHASLVGKFMIEDLARLPVEVDLASEFRYRDPIVEEGMLAVAISQSGETADTLAALREAGRRGARTLTVCNVVESSIVRDSQGVIYTHAGPEIGVASTKAFTTQLVVLYLLALNLATALGRISPEETRRRLEDLLKLPHLLSGLLEREREIEALARKYYQYKDFLYLGRGVNFPIALEGALKLKEISYIHAEGYPAGEMKHGPIALIDQNIPVVILVTDDLTRDKIMGNIEEVKARGGQVIALVQEGVSGLKGKVDDLFTLPAADRYLTGILLSAPLQLLAYHIAVLRGTDVDQPRNLAKSVTVE